MGDITDIGLNGCNGNTVSGKHVWRWVRIGVCIIGGGGGGVEVINMW